MELLSRVPSGVDSCLYVHNLPRTVDEVALADLFSQYGDVQSCRLIPAVGNESSTGIVNLASANQAEVAQQALHGFPTDAGALEVAPGPSLASRQSPSDNVYVRNMPAHWTEQELRDLFSPWGLVQECRILHRGDDVRGAGALVRLTSIAAASQAIMALNGQVPMSHLKDFTSLPLLVRYADSPEEKARKQARKEQMASSQHRSLDLPTNAQPSSRLTGKSLDLSPAAQAAAQAAAAAQATGLSEDIFQPQPLTNILQPGGLLDLGTSLTPSMQATAEGRTSLEHLLERITNPPSAPMQLSEKEGTNYLALNALNSYAQPRALQPPPPPPHPTSTCTSLYVKNLPPEADRLWLYERFAPHGSILSVKVLQEERSSRCRGVGFVNYAEAKGALNAINNVNGMKVADKHLHVSLQVNRGRF